MPAVKDYTPTTGKPVFQITLSFKNIEVWEYWEKASDDFEEQYKNLFRQCVYEIHKYLIRLTPIQSGELRSGWTGILDRYAIDYTRQFMDMSLLDVKANTGKPLDQVAVARGKTLSQWADLPLDVTVINNVPYSEFVEFGTSKMQGQHFTNRSRYKGEFLIKKEVGDWFTEMASKGMITKPQKVEEITA